LGDKLSIKIVTDSTADIPPQLARELDISVVPVYVRFGNETYRDRIDITEDQFYQRLMNDPVHPKTMQPSPNDFAETYRALAKESEGIISIHVTAKLSGTYNAAVQGKKEIPKDFPVEVIDSQVVTMGLGQLVIAASSMARSGKKLHEIVAGVKGLMPSIHLLGLLDTLKYLAMGGRIGKVQTLLSSILIVKPLLTMKEGSLVPLGVARSRSRGIERLFEFAKNTKDIQELAVVYNTTLDEAQSLIDRISSFFPREKIRLARLGPALGVHGGPGILFVSIMAAT
jgi:DegV family protein with EDD domain